MGGGAGHQLLAKGTDRQPFPLFSRGLCFTRSHNAIDFRGGARLRTSVCSLFGGSVSRPSCAERRTWSCLPLGFLPAWRPLSSFPGLTFRLLHVFSLYFPWRLLDPESLRMDLGMVPGLRPCASDCAWKKYPIEDFVELRSAFPSAPRFPRRPSTQLRRGFPHLNI